MDLGDVVLLVVGGLVAGTVNTMAGGGSLLIGLADRIRAETGMPVFMAADPLTSVVEGAGRVLEEFSRFGEMIFGADPE